ncbi:hypothetical protein [Streptomyces bobili]|uniref:hypothetical protein n=1 Tax=Streptomyces bobili TaxID=67280 RepID=UPI0037211889
MQFAKTLAQHEFGRTAARRLRGLLSTCFGVAAAVTKARLVHGVGLRHGLA